MRRCEKGDLAVITRLDHTLSFSALGKPVRCLMALEPDTEAILLDGGTCTLVGDGWWLTDHPVPHKIEGRVRLGTFVHDSRIRPLRPVSAGITDETLEWAGRPARRQ